MILLKVISMDTATPYLTVALYDAERKRTLVARSSHMIRRHAECLVPWLEGMLIEQGLGVRDLCAVAVGLGPGSYTGLRVGYMVAKTLAWAGQLPWYGFSSLRMLAAGVPGVQGTLFPLLDARSGRIYTAAYHWDPRGVLQETMAPCLLREDDPLPWSTVRGPLFLVGTDPPPDTWRDRFKNLSLSEISHRYVIPSAVPLARWVGEALMSGQSVEGSLSLPLYLNVSGGGESVVGQ